MMAKKKFKLTKTINIGSPDAETDDILFDVFIPIPNLNQVVDTANQKSILIGRTGTGKSAIIKYIKANQEHVTQIEPEEMSLRFLSNSTILRYFKQLDVNLNLFYKILWKHVFIVELLKLYFQDDFDAKKKRTFFNNLLDNITGGKKNPEKQRAIKYMEGWSNDFWHKTEYRVRSFEENIQTKFESLMKIKLADLIAGISTGFQSDEKLIVEAKQKAESVIHDSLASEIVEIVKIMRDDLFVNHQKKFYIVIDDLDKEWIEDNIRYELIGSMIEVIKEFRQFKGVKIVISLRENLSDLVFSGNEHRGGQREKIKPLFSKLAWRREELIMFLDERLKLLSSNEIDVRNAFYKERRGNKTGIDYVLERTFSRPRDLISFVNHAIEKIDKKNHFTKDIIHQAETSYSKDRFNAIEDEWSENYGRIDLVCQFLFGIVNGFKIKSISEDDFAEIYLGDGSIESFRGQLKASLESWRNDEIKFQVFIKRVLFILYRVGIIGVKKGPKHKVEFYFDSDVLMGINEITNTCRFYVHPSLYSYFKVNVMDQLPEE